MNLLLDTHVLLWWFSNDRKLPKRIHKIIGEAPVVYVSAVSALEISIKAALGNLKAPADLEMQMEHHRFTPLPMTVAHGTEAGRLLSSHGDPFDRVLIAQAQIEELTLVTHDAVFERFGAHVLLI